MALIRRVALALAGAATVAISGAALPPAASSDAAATATAAAYDACGPAVLRPSGTPWRCSFVDHFGGRALDDRRWLAGATSFPGFTAGSTCFKKDNVVVRDGRLRLIARDEGRGFWCHSPAGAFVTRYTGGHIGTRARFSQTYGRFEVRARHPATGAGVRAGFWLYPAELTYGPWPRSGEIDVAEWWSNVPTTVLPSLHYPGSDAAEDSGWDCTVADPTQLHTYTVEWTAAEMVFLIDRVVCFRRVWQPTWPMLRPKPFDHPFEMVLTMGVDSLDGPNAPTTATRLPAPYQVEYVKAWR